MNNITLIVVDLHIPKEYNGIQISESDFISINNKFKFPDANFFRTDSHKIEVSGIDFDTIIDRTLELWDKGEIDILNFRCFDKFGNIVTHTDNEIAYTEITVIPGYLKGITHENPK